MDLLEKRIITSHEDSQLWISQFTAHMSFFSQVTVICYMFFQINNEYQQSFVTIVSYTFSPDYRYVLIFGSQSCWQFLPKFISGILYSHLICSVILKLLSC